MTSLLRAFLTGYKCEGEGVQVVLHACVWNLWSEICYWDLKGSKGKKKEMSVGTVWTRSLQLTWKQDLDLRYLHPSSLSPFPLLSSSTVKLNFPPLHREYAAFGGRGGS